MTPVEPLHQRVRAQVRDWCERGHPGAWRTLPEILRWARGEHPDNPRHLREAQIEALETYWYLRVARATPRIADLYRALYPDQGEMWSALGLPHALAPAAGQPLDLRSLANPQFAALRETWSLTYPSYILSLAMGAGKTLLIGAIIATEMALAAEHEAGPFVQNALVFAPGKTILESLRELTRAPYHTILPPRLHRRFAARVKFTVTKDGSDELPIVRGSTDNVVVTNTEKIRIQQQARARFQWRRAAHAPAADERVNERLRAIATLPALAVFSDEAHHTYGQSLASELKRVRQTVDYLAAATQLVCVVNTTGTPYFRKQALLDVVCWYGLRQAIEDGVLKSLAGNIHAFDASVDAGAQVEHIVTDFFRTYGDVTLQDGARAKLAIYFPQTHDLAELRPRIEQAMARLGHAATECLTNTSDAKLTSATDIDAFHRLNDPASPHRVVLLVNKGTEGWNCPSLFACALVRPLKDAQNFVLQAATRCLRQVAGNRLPARVYLSRDNLAVLERQLRDTYGESVARIEQATPRAEAKVRPANRVIAPLMRAMPERVVAAEYRLRGWQRPRAHTAALHRTTYSLDLSRAQPTLQAVAEHVDTATSRSGAGKHAVATELAARYRLDVWQVLDELNRIYGDEQVPCEDVEAIARQIEGDDRDPGPVARGQA